MKFPLDPFTHPVKIENAEQYAFCWAMLNYMTNDSNVGYIFKPALKRRGMSDEKINEYIETTRKELSNAIEKYEQNQTPH